MHVDAGKEVCFYQAAKAGDVIDVEYQVIDGGHGDLDINFELASPDGRVLSRDLKKSDNIVRHDVTRDGDHKICFDNQFSSFSRKTVFFEIIIESQNEEADDQETNWKKQLGDLTPEEFYDIQVKDIQEYVGRIRNYLTKSRQMQDSLRSFEARDRNIAEENYFKVNAWSMFQICAMIAVGGLQVFMVRSIFDTGSKMYSVWKKLNL